MIARILIVMVLIVWSPVSRGDEPRAVRVRAMTFNIEDVRTSDLTHGDNPRLRRVAEIIQRVRPNILVLNEIARDARGRNAARFVEHYLREPQATGLAGMEFVAYMPETNTGVASGFDLDNSGFVVTEHPEPEVADEIGMPPGQTAAQRAYGNDSFGFGTFPGQYGIAVLVDPRLEIVVEGIRTYRELLWSELPGAVRPVNPDGSDWYGGDAWAGIRLSSKNHAVVPVRFPNGSEVAVVVAHPTPPAFDGAERRNQLRNVDEIRLLSMILGDDDRIVDDAGRSGGVDASVPYVVMGDLNADPVDGPGGESPIVEHLFSLDRMGADPGPESGVAVEGLDASDTASFGLRVDYVLASEEIGVTKSGVWRVSPAGVDGFPSDHFPVWAELVVPAPQEGE